MRLCLCLWAIRRERRRTLLPREHIPSEDGGFGGGRPARRRVCEETDKELKLMKMASDEDSGSRDGGHRSRGRQEGIAHSRGWGASPGSWGRAGSADSTSSAVGGGGGQAGAGQRRRPAGRRAAWQSRGKQRRVEEVSSAPHAARVSRLLLSGISLEMSSGTLQPILLHMHC